MTIVLQLDFIHLQNRLIKSELVSNPGRKSHGLSLTKQFSQHLEATISSCARTRQLHYNTLIKLISLDEIQKSTYDVLWIFTQVKRKRKVVSFSLSSIYAVELNPPRRRAGIRSSRYCHQVQFIL